MTSTQTSTTRLVLVRHGQSLSNRDGTRADLDSGLTGLGWRQAQAVADWLANTYQADVVLSSHLERARQTAEIIATRLGLPLKIHAGMEEAKASYWDELPHAPEDPLGAWNDNWQPEPATAPIYASFRDQIQDSLRQLLARYANQTVILVAHGGTIGTILRSLFGGHHVAVFTENTGVTQLTLERNHWRLVTHNSTAHLGDLTPSAEPRETPAPTTSSPWTDSHQLAAVTKQSRRVAVAVPAEAVYPGERELAELLHLAEPRSDDQVLDAATGFGAVALAFGPHVASVLAVDLSPEMLERAETARLNRGIANVHFRLGEIGALPLQPGSFQIITCFDLLHYITNPAALFTRFSRLLAASGRLVLDELTGHDNPVKRATQNAIELRRDPAMTNVLSAAEITRALTASGFTVQRSELYTVTRDLDEWLAMAAADDATRSAVRAMIEAGLEADSAGLAAKRRRDSQITFAQTRLRLVAVVQLTTEDS